MTAAGSQDPPQRFDRPLVTSRTAQALPISHTVVVGRFEGTNTEFTCYFPDDAAAGKRQLHYLAASFGGVNGLVALGAPANDGAGGLAIATLAFAEHCGAYLVESNQGHKLAAGTKAEPVPEDVLGYRANEAVSLFARVLARKHYGTPTEHAYVFGGSGGGRRTLLALERSPGTWDGAVPFAIGADTFAMSPLVTDSLRCSDPNGSTPPLIARALRAAGWPANNEHARALAGYDLTLSLGAMAQDYRNAFWERPGFAGADGRLADQLIDESVTVRRQHTKAAILTSPELQARVFGPAVGVTASDLAPLSDEAVIAIEVDSLVDHTPSEQVGLDLRVGGSAVRCIRIDGDLIVAGIPTPVVPAPRDLSDANVGETVVIDNRDYLAFCHAWRHDLAPGHGSAEAIAAVLGDLPPRLAARRVAGLIPNGAYRGRMIHIAGLLDGLIAPRAALDYADMVGAATARDGVDPADRYRLWFVENAMHRPTSLVSAGAPPVVPCRLVDQVPVVQRALEHLMAWVEHGTPPPPSTMVHHDGVGFDPAADADHRGGIQPTVSLTVDRSDSGVVHCVAEIKCPPQGDPIVALEWDLGATGRWELDERATLGGRCLTAAVTHSFGPDEPAHVAVRATVAPVGEMDPVFGRVQNVAWEPDPMVST